MHLTNYEGFEMYPVRYTHVVRAMVALNDPDIGYLDVSRTQAENSALGSGIPPFGNLNGEPCSV
jgi:hypothetical protein